MAETGEEAIKVLLIEDNTGDAEYIRELLLESGRRFRVTSVDCLSSGIEYLSREEFDVIILDLTLPDSRGIVTFERVYQNAPGIPVIIITGVDNEAIAAKTLQEGLQDYILKSNLSSEIISRSIRYAIERKRAETEVRANAESLRRELLERQRIEKALRESEEKYRSVVEGSSDGIVLVDEQGVIIEANRGEELITGLSRGELIGRYIWDVQHDLALPEKRSRENYEKIRALIQKILATGNTSPTRNAPFQDSMRRDGTIITVQSTTFPIRTEKGFMIGGIVRDVTDRKQFEEQIVKSLHEKEALLKEVHHRVKNNMQIITSLLSLQSSHVGDEMARAVLVDCQHRVKSMSLIHERLYMSTDFSRVDFTEYLKSLVASISGSYNVERRKVLLDVCADRIWLPIDTAIPCGLIVNELITNAVKHAFPGGREGEIHVRITCSADESCVLEVIDDGVGMRADLNLENTSTLGLQLVKILVTQISGTLEVQSHPGTTFRIKFKKT